MNTLSPSAHQVDLDAYLERIGYTGTTFATLDTLRSIHLLHTQAIPFENLDPLLNRPVLLDLPAIEAKLVRSQRGGYCYEHNQLFAHVLRRLGYTVTDLAARVLLAEADYTLSPRSHMLLLVRLDQRRYIADVGFGGNTLTVPLLIDTEAAQETPHGTYRALHVQGDFLLQVLVQGEWQSLYRFELTPQFPVDYVAINYYLSTCDASHFRQSLLLALATAGGRHTMFNDKLTTRTADGGLERIQVGSADEAVALLQTVFGINVPDRNAFTTAWSRILPEKTA